MADGAARSGRHGELTITREQVRAAVAAERSWDRAARRLGTTPGLAFMVASGIPADGSGVPELAGRVGGGPALSSPQTLVNPRGHNPLRDELVEAWVRGRAARELTASGAAGGKRATGSGESE